MALSLPVPEASWSEQRITLGGFDYTFIFAYNTRDERWRIDLYLDETPVILGVKLMENEDLLGNYLLENFQHGKLFCLRQERDGKDVGRDNLGQDLPYALIYMSNEEYAQLVEDLT